MEQKPTRETILNRIIQEAEDAAGFAAGTLNADSDLVTDLGMDSLDRIDFIQKVESIYNVRLNLDEEQEVRTLGYLSDVVCRKIVTFNNK